jgi:hypothetical protein
VFTFFSRSLSLLDDLPSSSFVLLSLFLLGDDDGVFLAGEDLTPVVEGTVDVFLLGEF